MKLQDTVKKSKTKLLDLRSLVEDLQCDKRKEVDEALHQVGGVPSQTRLGAWVPGSSGRSGGWGVRVEWDLELG